MTEAQLDSIGNHVLWFPRRRIRTRHLWHHSKWSNCFVSIVKHVGAEGKKELQTLFLAEYVVWKSTLAFVFPKKFTPLWETLLKAMLVENHFSEMKMGEKRGRGNILF